MFSVVGRSTFFFGGIVGFLEDVCLLMSVLKSSWWSIGKFAALFRTISAHCAVD